MANHVFTFKRLKPGEYQILRNGVSFGVLTHQQPGPTKSSQKWALKIGGWRGEGGFKWFDTYSEARKYVMAGCCYA